MTTYDAAMVGIIVAGMVWGAIKGVTWQLASIGSIVLGYLVAQPMSARIVSWFPGEPAFARSFAMMVVYALVSGAVFGVAWLIRATLRRLQFVAFDRHLGMLLGGLEGAVFGILMTMFTVSLVPQTRRPIFESRSGRVVGEVMDAMGPVLPDEVRNVLHPFWTHMQSSTPTLADQGKSDDKTSVRHSEDERVLPGAVGVDSVIQKLSRKQADPQGNAQKNRSRFGRAVVDAIDREIQRASHDDDERNPEDR